MRPAACCTDARARLVCAGRRGGAPRVAPAAGGRPRAGRERAGAREARTAGRAEAEAEAEARGGHGLPGRRPPGGAVGVRWERRRGGPGRGPKRAVTVEARGAASRTRLRREHSASHGAGSEQDGGVQVGAWPGCRSWSSACQAAWDRVVTCLGPVNTQPKGLLSHAYEIGGSTEVLAPITLGHIGQAEACVGLHTLTDPGLRGQETRLRRALSSPAGHRAAMRARGWASRNGGGGPGHAGQEVCLEAATEAPARGGPWFHRMRLLERPPASARSVALAGTPERPSAAQPWGPGGPGSQ